jgi:hypothetical protein
MKGEFDMGTARAFDNLLKAELNIHAAWLPVTNTFKLGDYGLFSDGVVVKMGNIKDDFGVTFTSAPGSDSKIDFKSSGTRILRTTASGEVNVLPDQDVDAKLTIEFASESSFLVKANLTVVEMQNLRSVARELANKQGWERKFRVVSAVYRGKNCTIISSKAANSKIELSGKANALKQFDLGSVAAEIKVSASQNIGVEVIGKAGAVGLALFKLGWFSGSPKVLAEGDISVETHDKWKTLEDDV